VISTLIIATVSIILSLVTVEAISWSFTMHQHGRWLQKHPTYERRVVIKPAHLTKAALMTGLLSLAAWGWFSHLTALHMFKEEPLDYTFYLGALIIFGIHTTHLNMWAILSKYVCLPEVFWPYFSKFRSRLGFSLLDIRDADKYCLALSKWKELSQITHTHQSLLINFIEITPSLVWTKDLQDRITFANKAYCDSMLLMEANEAYGKTTKEIAAILRAKGKVYTFDEVCCNSDEITKMNGQPTTFFEYGLIDGEYVALRVMKAPILNKGALVGTVGVGHNVTWILKRWNKIVNLLEEGQVDEGLAILKSTQKEFEGFRDLDELVDFADGHSVRDNHNLS